MANRKRKKAPPPEPSELIARIERYEQTYYISEDRAHEKGTPLTTEDGELLAVSERRNAPTATWPLWARTGYGFRARRSRR